MMTNLFLWENSMGFTINAILINIFWSANNILAMRGLIKAANWQPEQETV